MRQSLPNIVTLCNLFCGCCALLFILDGRPGIAVWFTLGSSVCDYADGMLARTLRVSSPLGKELDSLADVVSFGVVPGAMMYLLLSQAWCSPYPEGWSGDLLKRLTESQLKPEGVCGAALPAFVLSMFSALRLGKFNLDTRQKNYFIGLSTPACTVFVIGLTLGVVNNRFGMGALSAYPWIFYALTGILSWLLVSEVPMFGLKIGGGGLRGNVWILIFLCLFLALLFWLKELAFSAIVLIYIVLSIFFRKSITGENDVTSLEN